MSGAQRLMTESAACILERLRRHATFCRRFNPARGRYCDYAGPDVATARLARLLGVR